jgi:hypothetical protein
MCNTMGYAQERELWNSQQSSNTATQDLYSTPMSRAGRIPNLGGEGRNNLCTKAKKKIYSLKQVICIKPPACYKIKHNPENM